MSAAAETQASGVDDNAIGDPAMPVADDQEPAESEPAESEPAESKPAKKAKKASKELQIPSIVRIPRKVSFRFSCPVTTISPCIRS